LNRTVPATFFVAATLGIVAFARGDAPPPCLETITPANVTVKAGSSLSLVYQFQNPTIPGYPGYTDNITVAPIPTTDFYGSAGTAGGEFAELSSFPGDQVSIGPGQDAQFTLNFTTTGCDMGNSETWQFTMPQISYTWSASGVGNMPVENFGTPTVTLYETPEPSTLYLVGALSLCLCVLAWIWRRQPAPT
jgi:hypothetical protein